MELRPTFEALAVTKQRAAELTSISVRKIDQLIKRGVVKAKKIDRRVLIPLASLRELIEGTPTGEDREA